MAVTPEEARAELERRRQERSGATQAQGAQPPSPQRQSRAITPEQARAELARRRQSQSRPTPRQMRPIEQRLQDSSTGVRAQAEQEAQANDSNFARMITGEPRRVSQGEDIARSAAAGIQRGVVAIPAMAGDIVEFSESGNTPGDWLGEQIARHVFGKNDQEIAQMRQRIRDIHQRGRFQSPTGYFPRSSDINPVVDRATHIVGAGSDYEPQTTAGRYTRSAGEFIAATAAPGTILQRFARVAIPSAVSETAGEATRGTAAEPWARLAGGVIGGGVTEAAMRGNARAAQAQQARNTATAESLDLENQFGPLTEGERSGNARARLTEDDMRRGIGSDRAQSIMRTFDARRAGDIRERAMRIPSRGQQPISEDVGAAGNILADELRTARQELHDRASQQYEQAFEAARNEAIPPSDELPARIANDAAEYGYEIPGPAQRAIDNLHGQIRRGEATQANVERARQALNRLRTTAVNARDNAAEFVIDRVVSTLDDWNSGQVRSPEARRAMQEARGMYQEMQQLYAQQGRVTLSDGATGRTDLGGRSIDRAINTDLTGEQIIDSILGTGSKPNQSALGAVRRIRQLGTRRIVYTNRNAPSGERVPGRISTGARGSDALDMRTRGSQRFAADDPTAPGGAQLPTNEIQALREGMFHRLLRPLDEYLRRAETSGSREGGLLPAQTMVRQLDNALNGGGREITSLLFTAREMDQMRRFQRYLARIVPPPGAGVSGTPAGVYRMISGAFDRLVGFIPGLGPIIRESLSEANSTGAARRAVRPASAPRPVTVRMPNTEAGLAANAAGTSAATSAAVSAQTQEQDAERTQQTQEAERVVSRIEALLTQGQEASALRLISTRQVQDLLEAELGAEGAAEFTQLVQERAQGASPPQNVPDALVGETVSP